MKSIQIKKIVLVSLFSIFGILFVYSQPGVEFDTQDDAARNFGEQYNQESIDNNIEIGANIYQNQNGTYQYNDIYRGDHDGINLPFDPNAFARVHTHGAYDYPYGNDNNNLSYQDQMNSFDTRQDVYAIGNDGSLNHHDFDPNDNGFGEDATVNEYYYDSIPSDPRNPDSSNYDPGYTDQYNDYGET